MSPGRYVALVVLALSAMASDALDGFLARRWKVTSDLGYVLDALGDRAIHLALTLVVLVRFELDPIFVWLLIFRDIGIYAARILNDHWQEWSKDNRWLSLLHATNLRIWLAALFLRDGFRVFTAGDPLGTFGFEASTLTLLVATIALSYFGLYRGFAAVLAQELRRA